MEKYGDRYKEARKEKRSKDGYQCEVTGDTHDIECHHPHKMDLGLFDKGDYPEALVDIKKEIHRQIHEASDPKDQHLAFKRRKYAKDYWANPKNLEARERMMEIDKVLVPEYVHGLLENVQHKYRDIILEKCLIAGLHLNTRLMMDNHALDTENKKMKQVIQKAQTKDDLRKGKVVEMENWRYAKEE